MKAPIDILIDNYVSSERDKALIRADLKRIRQKDYETYMHSVRTTFLAVEMAKFLGLNPKVFVYATPRHDYGKVKVPKEVLKKTGEFTQKDRETMSKHPLVSYNHIVRDNPFSALVAGMHHMFNEKPYPERLPLGRDSKLRTSAIDAQEYSKVLAIVDFWDAAVNRKNSRFAGQKVSLDLIHNEMKKGLPKISEMVDRLFVEGFFNEERLGETRKRPRAVVMRRNIAIMKKAQEQRQKQRTKLRKKR